MLALASIKISRKYQEIKTTFAISRQYPEYQDIKTGGHPEVSSADRILGI